MLLVCSVVPSLCDAVTYLNHSDIEAPLDGQPSFRDRVTRLTVAMGSLRFCVRDNHAS